MSNHKRIHLSTSSSSSSYNKTDDRTDLNNDHITTQLLEQILMSSQDGTSDQQQRSTFTQKYKTRTHMASIDSIGEVFQHNHKLQLGKVVQQDQASNGVVTIQTQRSQAINNGQTGVNQYSHTAKNWRHLITPAHDSFKKLEKSRRPGFQYSSTQQNGQDDRVIGQGSTEQIANDQVSRQRPLLFTSAHTHSNSLEDISAPISLKHMQDRDDSKSRNSMSVNEFNTPVEAQHLEPGHCDNNQSISQESEVSGKQSVGMKSLMKSYHNLANADFYENLHRKYFNKAKGNELKHQKQQQPEVINSQLDDTGLFDLTEHSNILQASKPPSNQQYKNQVIKHNDEKSNLSINFKNSIYTKLTTKNGLDYSQYGDVSRNLINEKQIIFSDNSDSPEDSRVQKKEMSHLSRRDLSRENDPFEVTSGGGGQEITHYVFDVSQSALPSQVHPTQSQLSGDQQQFFSQAAQALNLKQAFENQSLVLSDGSSYNQSGVCPNTGLTAFYKQQVKLERQKLQSKSTIATPQMKNFETVPAKPQNNLVGSLRESALRGEQQSLSKLSGEGHQSDFTFVLSNPTTEQHTRIEHRNSKHGNNASEPMNLSVLQQSNNYAEKQQQKKNKTSNLVSLVNQNGLGHGGTAQFPDGIGYACANNGPESSTSMQQSILNYHSDRTNDSRILSGKQKVMPSQDNSMVNNSNYLFQNLGSRLGHLNLGEIPASPILSESDQNQQTRKYNQDSSIVFSRHQHDGSSILMSHENKQQKSVQELHSANNTQREVDQEYEQEMAEDEEPISQAQLFYFSCEVMERAIQEGLTNQISEQMIRLLITAQQLGTFNSQIVADLAQMSLPQQNVYNNETEIVSETAQTITYPQNQLAMKYNSLITTTEQETKTEELNTTVYSYLELESMDNNLLVGGNAFDQHHPIIKSLLSTKQQLRIEKLKTKKQENLLKTLQTQVESLTKKWTQTENKIKQFGQSESIEPVQVSTLSMPKILNKSIIQDQQLVNLNEKLSRQLKQNVNLLDDLNSELQTKEKFLQEQQSVINQKNYEVSDLKNQLGIMQLKVHGLAEMTKSRLDTQKKVHSEQQDDLEQLRQRQLKFNATAQSLKSIQNQVTSMSDLLPTKELKIIN